MLTLADLQAFLTHVSAFGMACYLARKSGVRPRSCIAVNSASPRPRTTRSSWRRATSSQVPEKSRAMTEDNPSKCSPQESPWGVRWRAGKSERPPQTWWARFHIALMGMTRQGMPSLCWKLAWPGPRKVICAILRAFEKARTSRAVSCAILRELLFGATGEAPARDLPTERWGPASSGRGPEGRTDAMMSLRLSRSWTQSRSSWTKRAIKRMGV